MFPDGIVQTAVSFHLTVDSGATGTTVATTAVPIAIRWLSIRAYWKPGTLPWYWRVRLARWFMRRILRSAPDYAWVEILERRQGDDVAFARFAVDALPMLGDPIDLPIPYLVSSGRNLYLCAHAPGHGGPLEVHAAAGGTVIQ